LDHLALLFAVYVYIIAERELMVNRVRFSHLWSKTNHIRGPVSI